MPNPTDKDVRFARLAAVLARGATAGEVEVVDVLRVLKHQLRTRNARRALRAPKRSQGAAAVIAAHAAAGTTPPQNGSPDALHSDHVFPLTAAHMALHTPEEWLAALPDLDVVVCVTAAENYRLQVIERDGVVGWDKYAIASIELVDVAT